MAKKKSSKKYLYKNKKKAAKPLSRKAIVLIAAIAVAIILIIAAVLALKPTKAAGGDPMEPTNYVEIDIRNYGTITAELYGNTAPETVENFVALANDGFYDGLTFHRIISGFMIQGGDPNGNGTGGSDKNIRGEFASNGVENNIAHVRGVLSMARSAHPDSASSQFFIMHEDAPHLDGSYAAFGRVLSGIEVVDAICDATPVTDSNGSVAPADQPVINSIREIEKPVA